MTRPLADVPASATMPPILRLVLKTAVARAAAKVLFLNLFMLFHLFLNISAPVIVLCQPQCCIKSVRQYPANKRTITVSAYILLKKTAILLFIG